MVENYKKLGDYIQPVNNRNKDLVDIPLLGVSIKKVLMPSIANIIGTDMSTYKLIEKNQFAYGPVTSRNGDKISIALLENHESAMISQAYTVFEVIDEKKLLPEYLMMWFRRPEFDRYARFKSHGSAREIFDWAEMCDTELPIPSPEKQQEIVREYNIIQNRIALNNQLIYKLEETAQAIYKQWFVDFEFPDENGKPYKSNGGEMVWCEELEKEIPVGWEIKMLKDFGKVNTGKTPSSKNPEDFGNEFQFITPSDFLNEKVIVNSNRKLSSIGAEKLKTKINPKHSVLVTCIGSDMGKVSLNLEECITNQQINSIIVFKLFYSEFLYFKLIEIKDILKGIAVGGSTMPMLSKSSFEVISILKPQNEILRDYYNLSIITTKNYALIKQQSQKLEELKELLLAKMTKVN